MNNNLSPEDKAGFILNSSGPNVWSKCRATPDSKEEQREGNHGCYSTFFLIPFIFDVPNLNESVKKKHSLSFNNCIYKGKPLTLI